MCAQPGANFLIAGRDAAKYFGIYRQRSSYKFYYQDKSVVCFNCSYANVFFSNGQDKKIKKLDAWFNWEHNGCFMQEPVIR